MKISLSRIRLTQGGYDSRGQYYGVGPPLYRVMVNGDGIGEVRALSQGESKDTTARRVKAAIAARGADKARYSW